MKKVSILGSTGSIGRKAVDLLLQRKEEYQVEALSAHSNFALLANQAKLLNAKYVTISNKKFYEDLKESLLGTNIKIEEDVASIPVDLAIIAIVGIAGLVPVMKAIESGTKVVALANKESIICGGQLLFTKAKENNVQIIPIDSEHNAIFQVLQNNERKHVEKIILTASGGPFLDYNLEQLKNVSVNKALAHPIWSMGEKISIDSATMMNKALEIIEAYNLFGFSVDRIEVVVHPESIVHGIIAYQDGFNFAVLAEPDMTIPIAYAMSWPERSALNYQLDLTRYKKLTFHKVDHKRFSAIKLGMEVASSHVNSIVFNAANEVAVKAFLESQIGFLEIVRVVRTTVEKFSNSVNISSLSDILDVNREGCVIAQKVIKHICSQSLANMYHYS
ncbi:MAG: 1-deoxy-D-xylulose-5-phosphate reductoisomerase [Wolbachia endosymbiont of Tyrophagus putrescentiae]|nr:1-deoxy-D-xylulose-5-phosphate reductoisomerase [Wolbachia endosymbiont of Tyrophagus putrescentiae]